MQPHQNRGNEHDCRLICFNLSNSLDGAIENLTRTGRWPESAATIDDQTYTSAAILELSA